MEEIITYMMCLLMEALSMILIIKTSTTKLRLNYSQNKSKMIVAPMTLV